jgi:hypothetical protein
MARWAFYLAAISFAIAKFSSSQSRAMGIPLPDSSAQASEGQSIKFEEVLSGSMLKKGTHSVSFQDYKSEDGVSVERRIETHRSSARARGEMRKMIRKAMKVIERGPKLPGEGQREGERAVLQMRPGSITDGQVIVAWTDGPDLYVIESPSLKHALALEKQGRHH